MKFGIAMIVLGIACIVSALTLQGYVWGVIGGIGVILFGVWLVQGGRR